MPCNQSVTSASGPGGPTEPLLEQRLLSALTVVYVARTQINFPLDAIHCFRKFHASRSEDSASNGPAERALREYAMAVYPSKRRSLLTPANLVWLSLCVLLLSHPAPAQSQRVSDSSGSVGSSSHQQSDTQTSGTIHGKVIDQSGASIGGATVKLTREGESSSHEVLTDDDGQFLFVNVAPGPFLLTFTSEGLAPGDFSGTLRAGEAYTVPLLMLTVATQVTEVRVGLTPIELAEVQIKEQEKQRVLGVIPNFYVSYVPHAVPLRPKQKFELAWKSTTDPITFLAVGGLAAADQATNRWGDYGSGISGYAKRYGATYGDVVLGTFIGSAILPSVFKQDPRYFYKGTGSKRSRLFYALANSVICKGDNGKWQANYSAVLGNLAAGGISNLYYPANDRNGAGLIISNALVRLGEMAVANVFQEFLVPKLTPNLPTRAPAQP